MYGARQKLSLRTEWNISMLNVQTNREKKGNQMAWISTKTIITVATPENGERGKKRATTNGDDCFSKWSIEHMNHIMDQWNPIANNKKQLNFINAQHSTAAAPTITEKMSKRKCIEFWSSIDFIRLFIRFALDAWMVPTKIYSVYNTHYTQRALKIYIKKCASLTIARWKNSFNVFVVFCDLLLCARSYIFFSVIREFVYNKNNHSHTHTSAKKRVVWCGRGRLNEAKTQFR